MPKRKFLVVMFSWLCLFGIPSIAISAKPPATKQGPTSPASFKPFPGYSSDPCYKARDQNVAAFCAEWKAADAAKSSADASWWTVYFAGFGIAMAAITMAAAIAAAYFANTAAYETKRSADAAKDANRPWLDVEVTLHGLCVNYDSKGYSLQLEVNPVNAGASPAVGVGEHVQCLFYEHITENGDEDPFRLDARDKALQKCADKVVAGLREQQDTGQTVFPAKTQPLYIETFVPWDFSKGYPIGIAWLVVGLKYLFPDGSGETVKVFSVKSFGFPNNEGFETIGKQPFATTQVDAIIAYWPRYGYVK